MTQFKVLIDFSTTVSEDEADELDFLVEEFVQGVLNVVANDEYDQIADTIANTADVIPIDEAGLPLQSYCRCDEPLFLPEFQAVDLADEGSDAQTGLDDGATDFDRR